MFSKGTLITILVICALSVTAYETQSIEKKHVNLIFRFDDYSARSSTDIELKIIDAFRKSNASITFGVIPFITAGNVDEPSSVNIVPLPIAKADILKTAFKQGVLDVALHGYSHQTAYAKKKTEFSGLPYDVQIDKLAKGKKYIEGMTNIPITTFVPPWNTYDLNTLKALDKLGFSIISSNKNGEATNDSKLFFLPASTELSMLRDAIKVARTSPDDQPLIVVLFHAYDFKEVDEKRGTITYQEFLNLLHWLKSQEDVRLLSISQASKIINNLSANRFLQNRCDYKLSSLLPSFLKDEESTMLYRESNDQQKAILRVSIFYILIVSFSFVLSLIMSLFLFSRSALFAKFSTLVIMASSIIIITYVFRDLNVHFKGMMASAVAVGISIGMCLSYLRIKRKKG